MTRSSCPNNHSLDMLKDQTPSARLSTCQCDVNATQRQERGYHRGHLMIEETVVAHRKREHETKEREALDPTTVKALEAEAKWTMESVDETIKLPNDEDSHEPFKENVAETNSKVGGRTT